MARIDELFSRQFWLSTGGDLILPLFHRCLSTVTPLSPPQKLIKSFDQTQKAQQDGTVSLTHTLDSTRSKVSKP
jgi:hypothetical protein